MAEQSERLTEIVRYLEEDRAAELARQAAAGGQHVHIHYHAAPPVEPQPVVQSQPDMITRAFPVFVTLLGGMIIVGGVVAMLVVLLQALMMAMIVTAVCAVAVAAAVGSLRSSKTDSKIFEQRLEATRPGKSRR